MQPLPRYRIYSRFRDYRAIASEVLTGQTGRGDGTRDLETAIAEQNDVAHALCIAKARWHLRCNSRVDRARPEGGPFSVHDF